METFIAQINKQIKILFLLCLLLRLELSAKCFYYSDLARSEKGWKWKHMRRMNVYVLCVWFIALFFIIKKNNNNKQDRLDIFYSSQNVAFFGTHIGWICFHLLIWYSLIATIQLQPDRGSGETRNIFKQNPWHVHRMGGGGEFVEAGNCCQINADRSLCQERM